MNTTPVAEYQARAYRAARRTAMKRAGRMRRELLAVFRPSMSPFGDTPATQWARLVALYHVTHTPTGDPR